jgi:3-oxoacyl-[acyl-carrier protein] reductase
MDLGLEGARCILAGGSRGIGFATAQVLIAQGARVAICARDGGAVESALTNLGEAAAGEPVDVRNAEQYRDWLKRSAALLGGCDIFIPFTSAGATAHDDAGWQASLEADLLSFSRGMEELLPWFEKSKHAAAVAVASTAALENPHQATSYASMKAALIANASAHAQMLAARGIRVNIISPGPIKFAGGVWDAIAAAHPEFYEATLAQIPIGRMGNPEEIARLITFVASPACLYMTGAHIVVDGALTRRVNF